VAAIDAVYTWVDGAWPGYQDLQRAQSLDTHDLNPNRYRDNLQLLKYSLRSLAQHVPWVRQVYVVTSRPQAPAWLDPSQIRLVHHDMFMPASHLPTFNSFAIVANLHRIEGLSARFLYIEDDQLFGAPVAESDVFDPAGRPRVYFRWRRTASPAKRHDPRISPWNRALSYSNHLLNERYGRRPRRAVSHAPLAIDGASWRAMTACWPEAFHRTSASRFRATENVAPEHLYPHFLVEERCAVVMSPLATMRASAYHPVNNCAWFQRGGLARLRWHRPKFMCLNDDFGVRPDPRVVALVGRALERWFPHRSRFEASNEAIDTTAIDGRNIAS
jgi:Stealth protein CR2, conserved region 2/Stealth protein CR4, conserved region 4/Stealth protein CR3, conserved region 3